ncbi:MAG: NUDIX domain-containing protein [Nanoarchaeota archaeon]|nr:NUDIX domain-containing protein [Nanoarchaeota archaeon]
MKKGKYRKGVFIVTYRIVGDKIQYLLLYRKLHWKGWEFPKGGVERFETRKRTAKRELFEETGQHAISLKKYSIKGKYKYRKKFRDRPGLTGQTYRLFSARIKNKKIIFDKKEHSGYKWVSYKKALNLLSFNDKKRCLKIVNEDLTKRR